MSKICFVCCTYVFIFNTHYRLPYFLLLRLCVPEEFDYLPIQYTPVFVLYIIFRTANINYSVRDETIGRDINLMNNTTVADSKSGHKKRALLNLRSGNLLDYRDMAHGY